MKNLLFLFALALGMSACHLEELADIGGSNGPRAAFTANPENCDFACTVVLTNDSENAVRYVWDFGDGDTSVQAVPPPHRYDMLGSYDIRLIAYGMLNDSSTATLRILVVDPNEPPIASFSLSRNHCFADNCALSILNTSTNAVRYEWDFGDDSTGSTLTNPQHTYTIPDTYTITLRAFNASNQVQVTTRDIEVLSRQFIVSFGELGPAKRVLQLPSSDYLIVGNQVPASASGNNIYLTLIDTLGNTRPGYPRFFGNSNYDEVRDAVLLGTGKVALVGNTKNPTGDDSNIFYMVFNPASPDASVIKNLGQPNRSENMNIIIEVPNSVDPQIMLSGNVYNNGTFTYDYFFNLLPSNGGSIYADETVAAPTNLFLYDGVRAADGRFWLVGFTDPAMPGATSDGYTAIVNTNGLIEKQFTLSNSGSQVWNSIARKDDNTAILTGQNGTQIWIGEVDLAQSDFSATNTRNLNATGSGQAIRPSRDGYVLVGKRDNKALLLLLDAQANLLPSNIGLFGGGSFNVFEDVIFTRDGGYLAVGNQGGTFFAVKTDQFGKSN